MTTMQLDLTLPLDIGNERSLKTAVLERAVRQGLIAPGATVAQEVVLGSQKRRVDLAVAHDRFIAFEIKSASDSLRRLRDQICAYSSAFDQTILVLAACHLQAALTIAPSHVGIWEASREEGLREVRPPQRRSRATQAGIIGTMTLVELEKAFGARKLSRAGWIAFAEKLSIRACRQVALEAFRRRFQQTSAQFWNSAGQQQEISAHQMAQLSRFGWRRRAAEEHRARQSRFWQEWLVAAEREFGRLPKRVSTS